MLWRAIEFFYGIIVPGGYKEKHITRYTFARLKMILHNFGFEIISHRYVLGCELIIKAKKVIDKLR